jgi:hypothetical protein
MHRADHGARNSSRLFAPVVVAVLLTAGLIRYVTESSDAPVSNDTPASTSIASGPPKQAEGISPATSKLSATSSPDSSMPKMGPVATVGGEKKERSVVLPGQITAVRVEQGLFTDIRIRDNVVCAADYPFLGIGKVGEKYVALNGIARNWASKNYLSVYRDNEWIAVNDSGVDPLNVGFSEAQKLIQAANDLCPSSSTDVLGEARKKMKEGEARLVKLSSSFGLGSSDRPRPVAGSPKSEIEMERKPIDVIAWHLTKGLGGEGQVGQKIRTTGGMACFRFDESDYRCVKVDSTHGRTAVLRATDVDEPEKQVIDEHCFTFARGWNDKRCGFNVTVVEERGTDHTETTFFYSSRSMKLTKHFKY